MPLCGEYAVSCGELKKLSAEANRCISVTYIATAERWRVARVFLREKQFLITLRESIFHADEADGADGFTRDLHYRRVAASATMARSDKLEVQLT